MLKGQKVKKKRVTPAFISRKEICQHLGISSSAVLDRWIADGSWPPPHSQPGPRHAVWLRAHWDRYVEDRRWPREAWPFN